VLNAGPPSGGSVYFYCGIEGPGVTRFLPAENALPNHPFTVSSTSGFGALLDGGGLGGEEPVVMVLEFDELAGNSTVLVTDGGTPLFPVS
jgi:hypothetical protein